MIRKTSNQNRDKKGRYLRPYEGLPMIFGVIFIWSVFYIYICHLTRPKLVSPHFSLGVVKQVEAKESVHISCEDPKGYLECQMYNGKLTAEQFRIMKAIGYAESGFNPTSKNKVSTARGVYQIIASTWYNDNYHCKGDKYNFKDNIDCAINIMKVSGYTPWEVYNTGAYIKYLDK